MITTNTDDALVAISYSRNSIDTDVYRVTQHTPSLCTYDAFVDAEVPSAV